VEPGQIVVVDVEGFDPDAPEGRTSDDKAKFVFRGEPKPVTVPDAPPVDMAQSGDE
jgi:ATP-dependent Clp protease ATP-binding subunit ClpC